ncbi:unnamed protein product [Rotaria sordida]|uniref:Uncharacterized protein n=1 Tax=Rotaria sordida TaxID=392033 RepID=A0A815NVR0_9BILA|nr:unnamed protein product [Rotaria sordida]
MIRSLGGKFHSLEQLRNESNIQIDFDKFFSYLLTLKTRNDNLQYRIHIEPHLTPQNIADIESVCSLDYTSSYINWSIVKTTNDKNQFQVKQWNSLEKNISFNNIYISQIQQIRAILNTLLHCHSKSKRPVYHISGRDVALRFGLFVGNEQSSAEFFLTNLIFNNIRNNEMISIDIDDQLKMNYHRTSKGQREPMAQCLLRALPFFQCVNEKKDFSLSKQ